MTPARFAQIDRICDAALELPPARRAAFVHSACGADDELRLEVESLLEAHEQAGDFIVEPALRMAADLFVDEDPEVPSLAPGHMIGHYRLLRLLGAGGMGEVYLAEDIRLERKVAIKLLPREFTDDSDRIQRFELEARAASALNHPNILTIYEIGRAGETCFIAAELVEGETLRAHMANGRMRLADAVDVAAQVASTLDVAHAAGVIHRDIKPENAMMRRDRIVKLLDFGLTKLTEKAEPAASRRPPASSTCSAATDHTNAGLVLGTVRYMSPEQTRDSSHVDGRTDIWSLGVVLYEMVAVRHQRIGPGHTEDPALHQFSGCRDGAVLFARRHTDRLHLERPRRRQLRHLCEAARRRLAAQAHQPSRRGPLSQLVAGRTLHCGHALPAPRRCHRAPPSRWRPGADPAFGHAAQHPFAGPFAFVVAQRAIPGVLGQDLASCALPRFTCSRSRPSRDAA